MPVAVPQAVDKASSTATKCAINNGRPALRHPRADAHSCAINLNKQVNYYTISSKLSNIHVGKVPKKHVKIKNTTTLD